MLRPPQLAAKIQADPIGAKAALASLEEQHKFDLASQAQQVGINTVEATSGDKVAAWARPAILWGLGALLMLSSGLPFLVWGFVNIGVSLTNPPRLDATATGILARAARRHCRGPRCYLDGPSQGFLTVLRLGLVLLSLMTAAAHADGPSAEAGVNLVRDGGPWGLASLFASVIVWLAFRDGKKDEEIKALNKALVAAAGKAETVAGDNTAALKSLEQANRATGDMNTERWDTESKGMSLDIAKVGLGVSGNAAAIGDLKSTIEGLRKDVGDLWRRPAMMVIFCAGCRSHPHGFGADILAADPRLFRSDRTAPSRAAASADHGEA